MLKYGGPTDTLPHPSASAINGYKVPTRTVAMMTTSSTLLASSSVSRDSQLKAGWFFTTGARDRKSTRLNSSHVASSYAVFCLKKKKRHPRRRRPAKRQYAFD